MATDIRLGIQKLPIFSCNKIVIQNLILVQYSDIEPHAYTTLDYQVYLTASACYGVLLSTTIGLV